MYQLNFCSSLVKSDFLIFDYISYIHLYRHIIIYSVNTILCILYVFFGLCLCDI